eukprot:scaffold15459_cov248-Alexandrium_tamarense.AAC.1
MANEKTKLVNNDDATATPAKKTTFGALVYRLLIDDFLSKYMVMSSLNIASYLATNLVDRAGLLGLAPSRLAVKNDSPAEGDTLPPFRMSGANMRYLGMNVVHGLGVY